MILAISFLSFLGAILLLYFADKVNPANRYLAFQFFLNAVYALKHWGMFVSDSDFFGAIFWNHYSPIYMLNAPFLYFYVRAVFTEKIHIKGWDYLFFLPFFIVLLNVLPYSILPWQEKLSFAHQVREHFDYIHQIKFPILTFTEYFLWRAVVSLLFIFMAALIVLRSIRKETFGSSRSLIRWLSIYLVSVAIPNIVMILTTIKLLFKPGMVLMPNENLNGTAFVVLTMAALTISIFFFPKILYGLNPAAGEVSLSTVLELNEIISRASKSADISEERLRQIDQLITNYIPKKRYLNPGFSLADLVQDVEIPLHVLSIYFNNFKGTTFVVWKNQLRIEQAIQLMESGKADSYTLESVGEACGYKSRSNFIQAFKAQTGESPSAYLKKIG